MLKKNPISIENFIVVLEDSVVGVANICYRNPESCFFPWPSHQLVPKALTQLTGIIF